MLLRESRASVVPPEPASQTMSKRRHSYRSFFPQPTFTFSSPLPPFLRLSRESESLRCSALVACARVLAKVLGVGHIVLSNKLLPSLAMISHSSARGDVSPRLQKWRQLSSILMLSTCIASSQRASNEGRNRTARRMLHLGQCRT